MLSAPSSVYREGEKQVEKQKITVRVAEKSYTLVSSESPEYMRRVASMVDRRLKEMEITTGLPAQQAMALTCFNLADELIKSRDEITAMKRRMQAELVRAADEEEPEAQDAPPERPRRRVQAGN